ncbi:MAG: flagellar biosynthetic protein FliR, partial [Alphaproteobacteria bacterium]
TLTIWFAAVLLAGEKIASSAGLGYAAQVDPSTGAQTPVVSQILYLFLLVIFLSVDGHLIALSLMLESYKILPVGTPVAGEVLIAAGISAAGSMFLAATIIMLPITMVLLLINVTIGIITRSAPQLNLFSFGFPISMLAVFVVMYFSVAAFGHSSESLIQSALGSIETLLGDLADG